MNAIPDAPPQSARGFWSIERFVAFILGPILAAGAGWLSTFLAREIGISLGAESIVAVFSLGGLSAAGLAYKWLHGRQVEMQANALLAKAEKVPGAEGFLMTTAKDLEGLIESTVRRVTHQPAQPMVSGVASGLGSVSVGQDKPPPEPVIPPAENDPAPAGQVADAGAAPAS